MENDKNEIQITTENYSVELLLPFGIRYREKAPINDGTASGTSASVSVTAGLDTDTDPPDTD